MIKKFFKNNWLILIGVAIGMIAGYFYWKFIGCSSGSCVISSSPINTALWFGAIGGLFFSIFKKRNVNEKN